MIIDLHTHTTKYSMCSIVSPESLVEKYISAGLDGVCITEHNRVWKKEEQDALLKKYGSKIRIFFGMEVDTDIGHALLFGSDLVENSGVISLKSLLNKIDGERSALIWAHPFRWESMFPTKKLLNMNFLSNFDAVELYNGNLTPEIQETTKRKLGGFDIKLTGASDAHSLKSACRYATRFEEKINSLEELVINIKYKNYAPVIL